MKSVSICAGLAALTISLASAQGAVAANAGGPHILVIDRKALFTTTKLGENIRQQLMGYEQKAQTELGPENTALQKEQDALGSARLPADVRSDQGSAGEAGRLPAEDPGAPEPGQGGPMAARKYFMDQIDAVVHAIMAEKGADVVLDKSTVVAGTNGSDITKETIQRLDQKAPSFKVPMVKPSLGDMLQMQNAQQPQQQQ
jgi:Skp family chaperone for outer membrane proteins